MSDYSPRQGYTRTGKSLKAVRRYYALKGERKRRNSPPEGSPEEDNNREQTYSRRKRGADDDKLSKRIAAELRNQQEVNEKLNRTGISNAVTDRSALPIVVTAKETGPTFTTPKVEPTPVKSVKSTKSARSLKTPGTIANIADTGSTRVNVVHDFNSTATGCTVACFMIALVYISTWVLMVIVFRKRVLDAKDEQLSTMRTIRWLALTSLFVIVAVPYWSLQKGQLRHALVCLTFMILSIISLAVYIVYNLLIEKQPVRQPHHYLSDRDSLNFWLPLTYLILHLSAIGFMFKHSLGLIYKQIEEKESQKTSETHMSQYLAPK